MFMPHGYQPPVGGNIYSVRWRADLGAAAAVGDIADYIDAFQTVLDLGERWGIVMAEEAAVRSLMAELYAASQQGEPNLRPLYDDMPWQDEKRLFATISTMLTRRFGEHDELNFDAPDALREVASRAVPRLLGSPPATAEITYRNPVELIIVGGAFGLLGVVQLLRIIRDWKPRRRQGEAAASMAEDEARASKSRADVVEYLGNEIVAGRLHVPASQLGAMITRGDMAAIAKLAGPEPELELPANVAEFFREEPLPSDAGTRETASR
jgi:hypothetical protein